MTDKHARAGGTPDTHDSSLISKAKAQRGSTSKSTRSSTRRSARSPVPDTDDGMSGQGSGREAARDLDMGALETTPDIPEEQAGDAIDGRNDHDDGQLDSAEHEPSLDPTTLYLNEIGCIPLLSAEQEVRLAREVARGNQDSKKRMIEANLRLVVAIAKRYLNRGLSLMDLVGEGNLGLIRAVEKFDPELGYRFSTYATWWIKQTIDRALMNHARTIRLPIHVSKELGSCLRIAEHLRELFGKEAPVEELALRLGRPVKAVTKLLQCNTRVCSGNSSAQDATDGSMMDNLPDAGSDPQEMLEYENLEESVRQWLGRLTARQSEVVARRFGLRGYESGTLEEVGQEIGLTRERVRQIQIESLSRLRRMLEREGFSKDCLED